MDVSTPLPQAPALYALDKGFIQDDHAHLVDGLMHWAGVLNRWREDQHLHPIDLEAPGGGAAGGLGFAMKALLDAPLLLGSRTIAHLLDLREAIAGCDAVLTGEGRMDASTSEGKVVETVIGLARKAGITQVACITGEIRGPMPLPPSGPDWIQSCTQTGEKDRDAAFEKAICAVADRLIGG